VGEHIFGCQLAFLGTTVSLTLVLADIPAGGWSDALIACAGAMVTRARLTRGDPC
jgi:hypothetical protein